MKWISLLLILFSIPAFGGTHDSATSDERHLEYGSKFHSVLRLRTKRASDQVNQYASCVVISKRHIVTAAHVVEGTFEWGVKWDKKEIPVTAVAIHPDYDAKKIGHNDIAVATLEQDIVLDFYPGLYVAKEEAGKVVSIAGYGFAGDFSAKVFKVDGKRRAGSNIIERIDGGMLVCTISRRRPTELEYCITPGDSGGGLFIGNELAGVNSLVMTDHAPLRFGYGEESGHTRVAIHKQWILEQMQCDD